MGKYVVSADEYNYIHKVILLSNEFYDDLIHIRHAEVNKEDFYNLAGHLVVYSELHGISHEGLCNVLKDIKGIQYEDVINVLLEILSESQFVKQL
jgi:hypothetical protein|uniref:Uncharacterized protein n=1 Tax=Siphoviridae sp. ctWKa2 TaxID=2825537 RepID=A0A8S5PF86_9CAUD|nr:MAG TPA: hypothetical protein [Siphoviridae sp. ctWKa2]